MKYLLLISADFALLYGNTNSQFSGVLFRVHSLKFVAGKKH